MAKHNILVVEDNLDILTIPGIGYKLNNSD